MDHPEKNRLTFKLKNMDKKLSKLNAKKVENSEAVKGGLMALASMEMDGGVTTHSATQRGDQYFCDHKQDN